MILLHGRATSAAGAADKTTDGHGPLGDGVDAAVGTEQRSLEEHPTLQRFRVAHRRDVDVDARAGLEERADLRQYDGSGSVLGLDISGVRLARP